MPVQVERNRHIRSGSGKAIRFFFAGWPWKGHGFPSGSLKSVAATRNTSPVTYPA